MLIRFRRQAHSERGATAIVIAFVMVVMLGFAAIAIDLGMGFNERRQDQTGADTGVMAGAVNYIDPNSSPTNEKVVTDVLNYIRANLPSTYTDPEWRAMWQACTDPERVGLVVGGSQVTFLPMDQPIAWTGGSGQLECISSASSYLRVRVPDQLVETSFGRILGIDDLSTMAAAVASIEPGENMGGLWPFGVPGGATSGEICLKSSGSGTAVLPCQGGSGGAFGEINSEFFGDYFGTASCANPSTAELEQNAAIGLDHFVATWPASYAAAAGVTVGSGHPGDGAVGSYPNIGFDQCSLSGGSVVPQNAGHVFPPNAMRVGTGFSPAPIESGLISDNTFLGQPSRLQQGSNPTRPIVKRRQGANETIYDLDNRGLWEYLIDQPGSNPANTCDRSNYNPLTPDLRIALIHTCLATYTSTDGVIFDTSISDSPRFGWVPQYWHALSSTGTSFQPVLRYRMVFMAGVYFNCSGTTCGAIFYPDSTETSEVCDPGSGSQCKDLSLSQLSAWLIPTEAIPPSIVESFPGGESPFQTRLAK